MLDDACNLWFLLAQHIASPCIVGEKRHAHGQVGVCAGSASRQGSALVDKQWFLPEAWWNDAYATRRTTCHIPQPLPWQRQPPLAAAMLVLFAHPPPRDNQPCLGARTPGTRVWHERGDVPQRITHAYDPSSALHKAHGSTPHSRGDQPEKMVASLCTTSTARGVLLVALADLRRDSPCKKSKGQALFFLEYHGHPEMLPALGAEELREMLEDSML
jgi:hypothetical protein